jgi:tetratricopeptide (TPR) repeat protein
MPAPVFISYSRKTSAAPAKALRDALGAETCFLDTEDIEIGDSFPQHLADALLAARVVVVFVDQTYFQRWYCLREWLLARAPFDALLKRGESVSAALLEHIVIALGPDVDDRVLQRLPPILRTTNWPAATATDALAGLTRSKVTSLTVTLDDRCRRAHVQAEVRSAMVTEGMIPEPLRLAGFPVFPQNLPGSLRHAFVGRANELWRLHAALTESALDSTQAAALTGALQGGGGFGKTQLAREYLHRFGPAWYRGGCFWIDASDGLLVERQLHGVLASLRPGLPSIEAMREAQRDVRTELSAALHADAATTSMLFVVDNVPEPTDTAPPPLETWCPALGKVTCVATSRKRIRDFGWVETFDVDVLEIDAATSLLTREVRGREALRDDEWVEIAEWVGRLPLALTLLNASLRMASLLPHELLNRSRATGPTALLDAQREGLRYKVPEGALRGITEAFEASYLALGQEARLLAQRVAWLAPAPIADDLLARLVDAEASSARSTLVERSFLLEARTSNAIGWSGWQMHRILADFLRTVTPDPKLALRTNLIVVSAALKTVDLDCAAARSQGLSMVPQAVQVVAQMSERQVFADSGDRRTVALDIAGSLKILGERAGEREPLEAALRVLLAAAPARVVAPLQWATVRVELGNVLQSLGERDPGTERLQEAVEAYRGALEERTRERAPRDWARTQNNLGTVLQTLGGREAGTARLEEAVAAYRSALEEFLRALAPLDWAITQNNLGNVLAMLGEREAGRARLEEAVAAYQAALEERTRERMPLAWAMTQNNLGSVLQMLGVREGGTAQLQEAVAACRAALEEFTRERAPLAWATTQSNLGNALSMLGARQAGTARLEEAVAAYRAALEERTRERGPVAWAMTQNNLGNVLQTLGERKTGTAQLEEAGAALRAALTVFESSAEHYASISRRNLAKVEALLEARRGSDS